MGETLVLFREYMHESYLYGSCQSCTWLTAAGPVLL
jgi:hypothetical protein